MPITVVSTPDGRFIDIEHPEGADENAVLSFAAQQFAADPTLAYLEPDTTILGTAAETLKGIPVGAAQTGLTMARGIAQQADVLTDVLGMEDLIDSDDDNELIRWSREASDYLEGYMDPAYREKWFPMLGRGLGSFGAFAATTALGTPAALVAAGASGAGEAADRMQMAREQGLDVSEGDRIWGTAIGTGIGFTELAPIERMLKGLPREMLDQPFMKTLGPRIKRALITGGAEGVQEVTANLMQDLTEKGLYNPDLQVGQSAWDEFTVGGATGFLADLAFNAVAGKRIRKITEQEFATERRLRRQEAEEFSRRLSEKFPEVTPEEARQDALALPYNATVEDRRDPAVNARQAAAQLSGNLPLTTKFAVNEANPGQWQVQDQDGNAYGPAFNDQNQAAMVAGALTEKVVDRNIEQQIDLAVNQSGQTYGQRDQSILHMLGRRLLHPAENTFTTDQVNYAAGTMQESGYQNEGMSAQEALDAGIKPNQMTAVQRINARRLAAGKRETQSFTVAEAQAVLKDKFGKLRDFAVAPLGANETFSAKMDGKTPTVRSNYGMVVRTRKATQAELDKNPDLPERIPFKNARDAKQYADYLNSKSGDLLLRSDLGADEDITTDDLRRLLQDKNITSDLESPEMRALMEASTGIKARGRKKADDLTAGERAILFDKIRSLPAFSKPTALPTFGMRPYTAEQYRLARQQALEAASDPRLDLGKPVTLSREQIEERAGPLSEAAHKRLLKDLAADVSLQRDIGVAQNQARLQAKRQQRQAEQTAAQQKQAQKERNRILQLVRNTLTGYGLGRVSSQITDYIRQARMEGDQVQLGAVTGNEEVEGAFNRPMNRIFIALEAIRTNPRYVEATAEQKDAVLNELVLETLNHETLHALRQLDLLTREEWELLEKTAARQPMPGQGGQTYLKWAQKTYGNQTPIIQMEEAIAEMIKDGMAKRLQIGGRPKSLMRRITEFLKRMVGIKDQTGFQSFDDLIEGIRTGQVGRRPTVDEKGQIVVRNLRATEAKAEEAGFLPPRWSEATGPVLTSVPRETPAEGQPAQRQGDWLERRVFHGSPHRWDRPDLSRVGTGEGAQAYGWGFYVADSRNVAESYKKNLSERQSWGNYTDWAGNITAEPLSQNELRRINELRKILNRNAYQSGRPFTEQESGEWKKLYAKDRAYKEAVEAAKPQGQLYEIEIPDQDVERMLDWDKLLSEQPENIRMAMEMAADELGIDIQGKMTGERVYKMLAHRVAINIDRSPWEVKQAVEAQQFGTDTYPFENYSKREVSRMLNKYGIPGIKYKDQASRTTGIRAARNQQGFIKPLIDAVAKRPARSATYNFVLFDVGNVQVLSRNGEPLTSQEKADVMESRRRTGTTMQYIGAPAGTTTQQRLGALLNRVRALAEEGEYGRFWYERSARAILDITGGNKSEADKLAKMIAITSQNTPVGDNMNYAIQAYLQHRSGMPVWTGRFPERISKQIEDALAGKKWTKVGEKTDNFYRNLMHAIDPVHEQGVTADIWMMRAFGHYSGTPSQQQYRFIEREIGNIAERLGWEPFQVQAAVWTALKSRMENADVKKKTNAISIRNGWAKKTSKGLRVTNKSKHTANWIKQAMRHKPTGADRVKAKFDYMDAAETTLAQISWETRPGRTTGHLPEAQNAPMNVLLDYHVQMAKALTNDQGQDYIAQILNVPSPGDFEAPGYFEGRVSPGTQTQVIAPRQFKGPQYGKIDERAEDLINAYAAARGILLRQDAVGWHRPFFKPKITHKDSNGVEIDIGRPFSAAETTRLAEAMAELSGHTEYNPIASPNGARLINFDYLELDNIAFRDMVGKALDVVQFDNSESGQATWFAAQTGYLENNWQENPNGEGYTQTGDITRRSDLQRKVRDLVRYLYPRVQAVEREFAERHGWTPGPDLRLSRRSAEPAGRPGDRIPAQYAGISQEGIVLSPRKAPDARTFTGVHYGKVLTDTLEGGFYGKGIRGAERYRVQNAQDERVKRRVYFYIKADHSKRDPYMRAKMEGSIYPPEAGVGPHVHVQKFANILDGHSRRALEIDARTGDDNEFEAAVIDAGYDGYAVPQMGMMVILNHDVPVVPIAHVQDLEKQGVPARRNREAVLNAVTQNQSEAAAAQEKLATPRYSPYADPEAQYVARNPDQGLKPGPDMLRSVRPATLSPEGQAAVREVLADRPTGMNQWEAYRDATGILESASKFKYFMTKAKQDWVNRHAQLEKYNYSTHLRNNMADTSSIAATLMADRAIGVVSSAIRHGVPVYVNGTVMVVNKNTIQEIAKKNGQAAQNLQTELSRMGVDPNNVKSLIEVMAPLNTDQHGDLSELASSYAIVLRGGRLNNEGKKTPVNPQNQREIIREVDALTDANGYNPVKQWYADWQAYNKHVINFMQATGVLNQETADLWREAGDYYPFYRYAEGKTGDPQAMGQRVFGGMTSAVNIRELKGGESPINMPMVEAIALNLSAAIQMGMKNVAQQRIVRDMVQLGLASELPPVPQGRELYPVEFRVNGQKKRYSIHDPLVYESMQPLSSTELVSWIKHTFGLPATALRELVTRDPGFMLVNLLRDSLSSYVTSGASMKPIISTTKGLFDGIERLEKMGVVGGYDMKNDPDDIKEFFRKNMELHGMHAPGAANGLNIFKTIWDGLGKATTASDAATRNAVFDDVLARTGNISEAAFQALEVINFSRRGAHPLARILGAVVPFLNARFQGMDVFWRAHTGRYTANKALNRSQVAMSAALRGSILMGATALYWMLVSDDDQYKETTDFQKDNNWIIPTPWGVPITIPIPFEVGLFYKVVPEMVLDTTLGERSAKEARETLVRGIGSTLELSPFQIQFAAPLMEAIANYDQFTGRPVVPQYLMDGEETGLIAKPYTSEIGKWLGQFGINPMKFDHVVRGYIGTLGGYAFDLLDAGLKHEVIQGDNRTVLPARPWYDYPVIRRWVGKQNDQGLLQEAYDLHREVNKAYTSYRNLLEDGRKDDAMAYIESRKMLLSLRGPVNNVKQQLDKLRRQKEAIQRADLSADEKRRRTDQIEAMQNAMLRNVIPPLKAAADQPFYQPLY